MEAPESYVKEDRSPDSEDVFRREFKRYKAKDPAPKLDEVIDFETSRDRKIIPVQIDPKNITDHESLARLGLLHPSEWRVFGLEGLLGFLFILNPWRRGCQRYWVTRCLRDYPCKPNVTNLDKLQHGVDNVWKEGYPEYRKYRLQQGKKTQPKTLLHKLRWTTLGYHYDWDKKEYHQDRYTQFPTDLAQLSTHVAQTLGFPHYKAQSAIVNYYGLDSQLGGHVDHQELDYSKPIISFSFGQTAIFLLGGKTKSVQPTAMFLRNGDIMVMSGDTRLAYHGVPKILKPPMAGQLPEGLCEEGGEEGVHESMLPGGMEESWEQSALFMEECRINITVRQVVAEGKGFGKRSCDDELQTEPKRTKESQYSTGS
ncbi:PREDICTED: DNA demethylase ALKBH1-like [Branchiostoma belcheri]|uniref:Nucleic acid dioxygenase ALKBH1 n=1 Tax=Branchiostoma belcheri TaxID=7741 RepID=A0A6P5A4K1_BRABE|nr:PREDICTED: DNA demethylase ALKBH1-like [Branchiostoma belcheri]